MKTPIDYTKPIETFEGKPVRLLAKLRGIPNFPFVITLPDSCDAATDGHGSTHLYNESGHSVDPDAPKLRNVATSVSLNHRVEVWRNTISRKLCFQVCISQDTEGNSTTWVNHEFLGYHTLPEKITLEPK